MNTVSVAAKRNDPKYQQLSGHIPVDLARTFKATCSLRGIDHSSGLEQALHLWLRTTPIADADDSPKSSAEFDVAALLKFFASETRPEDGELLVLANASGIDLEQLWRMRDRLFPNDNHQQKGKASNKV